MIKRGKKAQGVMGTPFNVIFSIILIAFIIAISIYAITYFMGINNCANIGLFYNDLQDEIDKAWTSAEYSQVFQLKFPSDIDNVCLGTLESVVAGSTRADKDQEMYEEFEYLDPPSESNIFFYPPKKACDYDLASNKLEHIEIPFFFCKEKTINDDFKITLTFKDREHSLVQIDTSTI